MAGNISGVLLEQLMISAMFPNLSVYFTLGRAKDNSGLFDLRYEGQSVGSVSVTKNGVRLIVDDDQYKNNTNERIFTGYPKVVTAGGYDWAKDPLFLCKRR